MSFLIPQSKFSPYVVPVQVDFLRDRDQEFRPGPGPGSRSRSIQGSAGTEFDRYRFGTVLDF